MQLKKISSPVQQHNKKINKNISYKLFCFFFFWFQELNGPTVLEESSLEQKADLSDLKGHCLPQTVIYLPSNFSLPS
jgi:hypothetical protein